MTEIDNESILRELEFRRELQALAAHDLRGPATILGASEDYLESGIKSMEEAKTDAEKAKAILNLRRRVRTIGSSGRKIGVLSNILLLSDITSEEIKKNANSFNVFEELKDTIRSYEHNMITGKELGLKLFYSGEIENLEAITYHPAFSSVFSNLVGNAVKYAHPQSIIHSMTYLEKGNFIFELENMVSHPIDSEELMYIFEKGYRRKSDEEDIEKKYKANQGLGLYFVQRIIKNGYSGRIGVSSGDKFLINKERVKDINKKEYGIIYPESYIPFPSFHTKVSIPMENIRETKKD